MLGFFKKRSEKEQLEKQYKKCLEKAYKLQTVNRSQSDKMYQEAQEIMDKIELLNR